MRACARVCVRDLAVNSSCESFPIALDSSFLKGLSGGSGLIVLGQANWPPLAATLSYGVLLDGWRAERRFTCTLTVWHRRACWTAVDLRREKIWMRLFGF